MENPIKMDDLGVTPIFGNTYVKKIHPSDSKWPFYPLIGGHLTSYIKVT